MIATVEISLYPLHADYKERVIGFIRSLYDDPDISVWTNEMSTYIKGDLTHVMTLIGDRLSALFEESSDYSTIIKIIPKDLPVEKGFLDFR